MDKLSEEEYIRPSHVHESVKQYQAGDALLKLGNKVIFNDENDKPVNGIVRWIGENRHTGTKFVGIETVSFY